MIPCIWSSCFLAYRRSWSIKFRLWRAKMCRLPKIRMAIAERKTKKAVKKRSCRPDDEEVQSMTLDEYLGSLKCTSCGWHCSLLSPWSSKGKTLAQQYTIAYESGAQDNGEKAVSIPKAKALNKTCLTKQQTLYPILFRWWDCLSAGRIILLSISAKRNRK